VSKVVVATSGSPDDLIELKDPVAAAILAWLVPGLGHFYQGRSAKGMLFMVCVLGTFFYGLFLSEGRAVYASWTDWDKHLPYLCQVGAGLPALPALVQTYRVRNGEAPFLGGVMAPPATPGELNDMHRKLHQYLELGTVYTMIAGLLNVLVIYDAWGGPVQLIADDKKRRRDGPQPASPDS